MATVTPAAYGAISGPGGRLAWIRRHPVAAFLVVCLGLTWLGLLPPAAESRGWLPFHVPSWLLLLADLGPALAAFSIASATGRSRDLLARITRWRFGVGWYLVAVLGPAGVYATAHSLDTLFGGPPSAPLSFTALMPGAVLTLGLGLSVISVEIGWRGFLLPRLLERYSPLETSVVLGIIWTAWHLPYFGWVGHILTTTPLPAFTLFGLASSVVLTWLYIRTGNSALSAIVLQSANFMCQMLLHVAPSQRPFEALAGLYALVGLLLVFSRQLGTGVLEPDSGRAAE